MDIAVTRHGKKWLRRFMVVSATSIGVMVFSWNLSFGQSQKVYVLLYNPKTSNEGIHTIKTGQTNTVLMFVSQADANLYANRLKKQNFPRPTVAAMNIEEISGFCRHNSYVCRLIPAGATVTPPASNLPPYQRDYR